MSTSLDKALDYARAQRAAHLAALLDWLRIPSISTLPEHRPEMLRAAEHCAAYLRDIGLARVEIRPTNGHPLVYAEWLGAAGKPTLLIYGHYDVQPVDPLEDWARPPFEPCVEGDTLYARGASDDKGQVFALLAGLEAILRTQGRLPLNVKILVEGEEEVTSPNLFPYLREHASELACDAVLIADQDMLDPQHPVLMWGVRGNLYVEIEVHGPARDLHSGTFGGAVDNPLNVLVRLLAGLQDGQTRRVLIPGFYDQVEALTAEERALIAQAPIDDATGLYLTGAPGLGGEEGYPLAERVSVRPTLEVHGIAGGFTGEGSKTVIPARALAKVSTRLVPAQDPEVIFTRLEAHLRAHCPPTVRLDVRLLGKAQPVKIDYRSPAVQAAAHAYHQAFGVPPLFLRGGGSLPIVHEMINSLSSGPQPVPIVMIGFGLPDDCTHAPNEKFHLPNFYLGVETAIHFYNRFAEL